MSRIDETSFVLPSPPTVRWEDVWTEHALGAVERTWHDAVHESYFVMDPITLVTSAYQECNASREADAHLIINARVEFDASLDTSLDTAPSVTWLLGDMPSCSATAVPYGLPLPIKLLYGRLVVRSDAPFTLHYKYASLSDREVNLLEMLSTGTRIAMERVPDALRIGVLMGRVRLLP